MLNVGFVIILGVGLGALLTWGIRTLPGERWQMLAVVPLAKSGDGAWRGLNLTFYGFFSASGMTFGFAVLLLLLSSIAVPLAISIGLLLSMVVVCVPASRLIAGIVERKSNTFTVAGAVFVATLLFPWLVMAADRVGSKILHQQVPALPVFAAAAVSYVLGESIGRLACLSFGCCYGMPLRQARPLFARLFRNHNLVMEGATKKACYASGFSGEPLLPVQALTSTIFALAGLAGLVLFLDEHFRLAALVPLVASLGWRTLSEQFRADYRGDSRWSIYQLMSLACLVYVSVFLALQPAPGSYTPDLGTALRSFTSFAVLIGLQILWVGLFLYYGKSRVTGSTLSFHVVPGRV
jgi:Prolipoprotein diacylglyceryl transferase